MSPKPPDLDAAYGLRTPQDSRRLYADWARTYDTSFAEAMDYRMPGVVAAIHAEAPEGPVLDVGAGTGLVGAHLARGQTVDALDISPQMLEVAMARGVYRAALCCDLTRPLPLASEVYGAVLSAGTFTHGHVGPEALEELLRIARPGGRFVLGINAAHFAARGFADAFAGLDDRIDGFALREVDIYGPGATPEHRGDRAQVAVFRKR